jgi:hypothetical protein
MREDNGVRPPCSNTRVASIDYSVMQENNDDVLIDKWVVVSKPPLLGSPNEQIFFSFACATEYYNEPALCLHAKILYEYDSDGWSEQDSFGLPESLRELRLHFKKNRSSEKAMQDFTCRMIARLLPSWSPDDCIYSLLPGDQIFYDFSFGGTTLTHHGIYIGKFFLSSTGDLKVDKMLPHRVVEVSRRSRGETLQSYLASTTSAHIKVIAFDEFVGNAGPNGQVSIRLYNNRLKSHIQTVSTALEQEGNSFIFTGIRSNCESFCFWCIMDYSRTFQGDKMQETWHSYSLQSHRFYASANLGCVAFRAYNATSKVGNPLFGGAKIMSGLKIAGGGTKVIQGVANITSGVGGLAGAVLAEQILGDGTVGRNTTIQVGSFAGSMAAASAVPAMVASAGGVTGLSAAGISSGLVYIGGSMIGGVAVLAGAGALAAVGGAAAAVAVTRLAYGEEQADDAMCNEFFVDAPLTTSCQTLPSVIALQECFVSAPLRTSSPTLPSAIVMQEFSVDAPLATSCPMLPTYLQVIAFFREGDAALSSPTVTSSTETQNSP